MSSDQLEGKLLEGSWSMWKESSSSLLGCEEIVMPISLNLWPLLASDVSWEAVSAGEEVRPSVRRRVHATERGCGKRSWPRGGLLGTGWQG